MDLKDYFVFTWRYDRGNPREAEITNEGEHLELRISREFTVSEEIVIDRETAQKMYDALGKWLAKQPAPARQESDVVLQVTHHGKLQPSDNPALLDDMSVDDVDEIEGE